MIRAAHNISPAAAAWPMAVQAQVTAVRSGLAAMELSLMAGPGRHLANLWKPLIDALGSVLGEVLLRVFQPNHDRIVRLGLQHHVTSGIGHDVTIDAADDAVRHALAAGGPGLGGAAGGAARRDAARPQRGRDLAPLAFRAAGGVGPRPSEAIINDIVLIRYVARTMIPDGPLFEVAVVHHTGRGTGFLADASFRSAFAARTGLDAAMLAAEAVVDPASSGVPTLAAVGGAARGRRGGGHRRLAADLRTR